MQTANRREFLIGAGGVALGVVAVSGLGGALLSCTKEQTAAPLPPASPSPVAASPVAAAVTYPYPYKTLDAVAAAERAYTAYSNGGCMYGAFEGIVGELGKVVGAPFTSFPSAMMKYGGAGVSGWGTLCGCLNGAAAAINLLYEPAKANPIINELFGWYGVTALPDYTPKTPKFANIPTSVANSQLCHVSVTNWCDTSKFKATSPERADRCAWLTASTVKYTVDLLNKQSSGSFAATFKSPESVTGCLSCHGKGGVSETVHANNATTCTSCHAEVLTGKHPIPLK